MCVSISSDITLEKSSEEQIIEDKRNRITVDDDFHCLGYSIAYPGQFPVCVKGTSRMSKYIRRNYSNFDLGIQSITEKAIMSPDGIRLDLDYDRVSTLLGSGNML